MQAVGCQHGWQACKDKLAGNSMKHSIPWLSAGACPPAVCARHQWHHLCGDSMDFRALQDSSQDSKQPCQNMLKAELATVEQEASWGGARPQSVTC